jgi:uncharacterized membrane protein
MVLKMSNTKKTTRVPEIELMKAIAIIAMVMVHVLEGSLNVFENAWELPGSIPYTLIEFFGGIPAAGVFTFAMGWGAAFSDRSTPISYLKRAFKLGLLLFYVNFVYAILPGLLDPADFGAFSEHPYAIIGFNIYSLATICMLFFALMKKLADKPAARAVICLAVVVAIFAASILVPAEGVTSGNPWIDTLIGIFVRQNHYSWFPLVPWAIFPVMGYGFGLLYRRWEDRKRFALASLGIGAVVVGVSQAVIITSGMPNASMNPGWVTEIDYYALTPWNIVCACGMVCLEMAIAFGIMTLAGGRLHPVLSDLSKNVMEMFVAHWIFVSPLYLLLIHVTSIWINAAVGIVVFVLTYAVVRLWNKVRK